MKKTNIPPVFKTKRYPVLFLMIAVFLIAGCGNEIQPGNTPEGQADTVKAKTMMIDATSRPVIYEAVGTVAPLTGAAISAKVMGQIREVRVHEGQQVKKGEVLIVIDGKEIATRVDQARAGLDQAQKSLAAASSAVKAASARATLSEQTYKRYQALLKTDSISRQEFDQVEAAYLSASAALDQSRSMEEAAKGAVAQAKASLAGARSVLSNTIIESPYDALIKDKAVDPGDMAAPGKILLSLEKMDAFDIKTVLPESHINAVHLGDAVTVMIDSFNGTPITGTIRTIEPASDPASRSFAVKISIPSITGLKSGLFARVRVTVGRAGMIIIPDTALVSQGQLRGVFIVDAKHIARFRLVRPGKRFADQVEILSGLEQGEQIVVQPDFSIKNGVSIEKIAAANAFSDNRCASAEAV